MASKRVKKMKMSKARIYEVHISLDTAYKFRIHLKLTEFTGELFYSRT